MLCASGLTLDAKAQDAFDILVGPRGELTVALLSITSPEPASGDAEGALDVVRHAVLSGDPIYSVVAAVREWSAGEQNRQVGLTLVRFSQPDSRVEILNAGMPAVACAAPGGRVALHGPLSRAIGERFGEVHPYELCPLVWGSAWFLLSSGATRGSLEPELVRRALGDSRLHRHGAELAASEPASLAPFLEWLTAHGERPSDASLIVVHADPTRRFESGIRS